MRKTRKPLLSLLAVGVLLAGGSAFAQDTWYVDNDPAITTRDGQTTATAFLTVAAAITAAGANDTIVVEGSAGLPYAENLLVNKSLTLQGVNSPLLRNATSGVTAAPTAPPAANNRAVIRVSAQNITIDGFTIEYVYAPNDGYIGRAAILNYDPTLITDNTDFFNANNADGVANVNGLVVSNNTIRRRAEDGITRSSTGGFAWRSIGIGVSGNGVGDNSNITISNNVIEGAESWNNPAAQSYITHGVFLVRPSGTYLVDGNEVFASYTDLWTNAIKNGTTTTISDNAFTGLMGFDISSGNGGTYNLTGNTFAPSEITDLFRAPDTASNAHLQNGYINGNNVIINFTGNDFIIPPRRTAGGSGAYVRPMAGIWAGGNATTTLTGNTFSARAAGIAFPGYTFAEEFTYVYVDTITSSVGASNTNKAITIEGNTFEGPTTPGANQVAIELYRTQGNSVLLPTYLDGGVIIGNGNVFEADLEYFIRLDDGSGVRPSLAKSAHGIGHPFNVNVDGAHQNLYAVGGAPKLISEMDAAERAVLESKLYHAPDNVALGYIYLDGAGVLNVGPTFTLANAVAAARTNDSVVLPSDVVTNAFNVQINKAISLVGNGSVLSGNGASPALIAPNGGPNFTVSGIQFINHGAAFNIQASASPRVITITDSLFEGVGSAVTVGGNNTVNMSRNVFSSATSAFFTPNGQFTGLNVNNNIFLASNVYRTTSATYASPAPNFDSNWFADEFDVDADNTGYITGLSKTVSVPLSTQVVTAGNVVAQFDRDGDGIPDVLELAAGSTTNYNNLDTDGSGLPDGVEVGTDPNEDLNGSRYADWYEKNLGFVAPSLGDVTGTGSVTLGDAIRALQIINGASVSGNLNNLNVTGNVNTVYSIANPLQILRYQATARQLLPAIPGVN